MRDAHSSAERRDTRSLRPAFGPEAMIDRCRTDFQAVLPRPIGRYQKKGGAVTAARNRDT